jgi:pyruvate dehydrogenase E2 component (dihydrolipoamide acetyltransferase)
MADITMPQLGETVTEGTITKWFKQVGDQVAEDEPLFEVSTDKVDSEVPAPASGYLVEIRVPEGETVDVGAVLAVLGDSPPDGSGDGGDEAGSRAEEAPAPEPADSAEEAPAPAAEEARRRSSRPSPRAGARARSGARRTGEQGHRRQPAALAGGAPPHRRARPRPATIEGTGVGGRITRNDVLAVVESGGGEAPRHPPPSAPAAPAAGAPGGALRHPLARARAPPVGHAPARRHPAG